MITYKLEGEEQGEEGLLRIRVEQDTDGWIDVLGRRDGDNKNDEFYIVSLTGNGDLIRYADLPKRSGLKVDNDGRIQVRKGV